MADSIQYTSDRDWGTVLAAGHQTVGEDHPDRKQQPRITGFGGATPSLELPSIGNTVNLLFHDEYSYAENEAIASPESAEWNHALSEIVMAVIDAGLTLELLTEHDSVPWDALLGMMVADDQGEYRLAERPERLPASFTLVARLV